MEQEKFTTLVFKLNLGRGQFVNSPPTTQSSNRTGRQRLSSVRGGGARPFLISEKEERSLKMKEALKELGFRGSFFFNFFFLLENSFLSHFKTL